MSRRQMFNEWTNEWMNENYIKISQFTDKEIGLDNLNIVSGRDRTQTFGLQYKINLKSFQKR